MPDPDHNTDELLRRAAGADPDATAQLLTCHRDRLRRMIAVRIDPRLAARMDPSDILQDVLASAVAKIPEYATNKPLPFYPWLRRLAWQRLVEAHRTHVKAQRRTVVRERSIALPLPGESEMALANVLAARQSSPSALAEREQMKMQVQAALRQLRKYDRELLVLRYLEQLSMREIADVLGSSEAAIKMRHMRALTRLGSLLGGAKPH